MLDLQLRYLFCSLRSSAYPVYILFKAATEEKKILKVWKPELFVLKHCLINLYHVQYWSCIQDSWFYKDLNRIFFLNILFEIMMPWCLVFGRKHCCMNIYYDCWRHSPILYQLTRILTLWLLMAAISVIINIIYSCHLEPLLASERSTWPTLLSSHSSNFNLYQCFVFKLKWFVIFFKNSDRFDI